MLPGPDGYPLQAGLGKLAAIQFRLLAELFGLGQRPIRLMPPYNAVSFAGRPVLVFTAAVNTIYN